MVNNNAKYEKKSLNFGIELLRFILCLWIVILHCSNVKNEHKKYIGRGFHVPTFILISFYFYFPTIKNRNILKINSRFQRLLLPYCVWPIIRFILNNFLIETLSIEVLNKKLSLYDFYLQILTGCQFHRIFWFQFNLIFLSLFITIISFIFKKNFLLILKFLGFSCLYMHCSEKYLKILYYFHKRFQISLGSLYELFPLSVLGCIFCSIDLLIIIKNIPKHIHIILFLSLYCLFRYNIFIIHPGFMYPHIVLNSLASTILLILFGSLNLNKLRAINSIIIYITKYTGGVYYIHPIVRDFLQKYILFFKKKSYFSSFVVYYICFFFCYLGTSLFKNYKLKYLFN